MYGLPKSFDPTRLIGHTLLQICFGIHQIAFHFDNELSCVPENPLLRTRQTLSIAVESALSYKHSPYEEPAMIEFPVVQSDLLQLLHHSIVDALGDNKGTLALKFDNGHVLQLFDQPHYEAYQIRLGDEEIIV